MNESVNNTGDGIPPIIVHQVIYLSLVGIVGIIANSIVLVKSIQHEWRLKHRMAVARNSTNFLVISLAIADLGTSSFSIAMFVLPVYVQNLPVTDFTCRYIQPLRELFIAVSVFCFALIAVGRYLILLKSSRMCKFKIFSSNIVNNLLLWLICYLIFALPFSLAYKLESVDGSSVCEAEWSTQELRRAHRTTLILLHILLPTLMVCLSYIGIIQRLHRARRLVFPIEMANAEEQGTGTQRNNTTMQMTLQSHRIVKVSFLLLVAFFITYIPYAVLVMSIEYTLIDYATYAHSELLHAVATCLIFSSVVVNPLIIIFTSDLYRPKCPCLRILFTRN